MPATTGIREAASPISDVPPVDSGTGFIMSLYLKQALLLSSAPPLILLSAFVHPASAQDSASELPSSRSGGALERSRACFNDRDMMNPVP